MVFVRPHDAVDLVPVRRAFVGGQGREEPRDLQHDLGAVRGEEVDVVGRLAVAPHVVGDGQPDVALQVRVVGQPASRTGVEVDLLGLLPPVGGALPRVHRAAVPGVGGRAARRGQAPPPVHQQRAGDLREPHGQEREDEQLVPEDVAPVRLAVQAAGGDPDVQVHAVLRHRLQQVEDVEVEDPLHLDVVDAELAAPPQPAPRERVPFQQGVEAARAGGRRQRRPAPLLDGVVA